MGCDMGILEQAVRHYPVGLATCSILPDYSVMDRVGQHARCGARRGRFTAIVSRDGAGCGLPRTGGRHALAWRRLRAPGRKGARFPGLIRHRVRDGIVLAREDDRGAGRIVLAEVPGLLSDPESWPVLECTASLPITAY